AGHPALATTGYNSGPSRCQPGSPAENRAARPRDAAPRRLDPAFLPAFRAWLHARVDRARLPRRDGACARAEAIPASGLSAARRLPGALLAARVANVGKFHAALRNDLKSLLYLLIFKTKPSRCSCCPFSARHHHEA